MNLGDMVKYKDRAIELAMVYAPKVLLALLTLIIGLWLIGGVRSLVGKALSRKRVDPTLAPFVLSLLVWVLKAVLFISVASMIGIETTSFVAILGAAGLAVGLALQGSLSNFAGGVLILIFRPYEVGHFIEAQGHQGTVKEIQIFTTVLLTPQNRRVILPNGALSNGPIVNHTVEGTARVDLTIPIEHKADPEKARQILLDVLQADERVLAQPPPTVMVSALGDTVTLAVRPHCKVEDYWGVHCDTLERGKARLEQAGIGIPFLAREVYVPPKPA
ncbi:MAG TPA: mechanosensitive ion channel domain-containing protein [Polyangiaceae bacterium]|nr:mechanosensitive ion channel domain-containing protein [Polyangiaceae bacterium]